MATILVVDDHASNRELLVTLLGYKGHRLLEAADGAEALGVARTLHPDMVITDILMPTMDGYEFVRQLRADPTLARIPVIFSTAHYHEQEAQKLAQACGVSRILTKPCEPGRVVATVEHVLGFRQASAVEPAEEFDRGHLRLLTDKLSQKATDLQTANLRFAALIEVLLDLTAERKPRHLLEKVCRAARDLVGAKWGALVVEHFERTRPGYCVTSGMEAGLRSSFSVGSLRQGSLGNLIEEGRVWRVPQLGMEPEAIGFPAGFPRIHSMLGAPISCEDRRYGWLFLIDRLGAAEFSEPDERLAVILATHVGRIYQNRGLYAELQQRTAELETEVTERERAEAQVRQLNQNLEQRVAARTAELELANNELDAFAHSVSHDLRAPLRHVLGYAELLQGSLGECLDEKSRHYLDTIVTGAQRMGNLIDHLLEFARTSVVELRLEPLDLEALAQEAIDELEPELRGRSVTWKIAPMPEVHADRALLRLALSNLIGNALKYTRQRPRAEIEIGSRSASELGTVVFVRDNGAGFDMKYANKLFGVFQRLHRAEEYEGTGVGLANVRRIIHRHGGQTWAEAAVDQGATFYFSLPIPRGDLK